MKIFHIAVQTGVVLLCAQQVLSAQNQGAGTTNLPPGLIPTTAVAVAPSATVSPADATTPSATNGAAAPNVFRLGSTFSPQVTPTDYGCEATYGKHKLLFQSDIGSERPITLVEPQGRTISFRPSFLVIARRSTDESLLLGAVTNCTGFATPESVVWSNVFDAGPTASLYWTYSKSGAEQNLVLEESFSLPDGWEANDVELQFWTEMFGAEPLTIEEGALELRSPALDTPGIAAADTSVTLGAMKIVGSGRAFAIGDEQDSLPVAKAVAEITDQSGATRRFIIERLDYLAAQSQIQTLPQGTRHASVTHPFRNRREILQANSQKPTQQKPERLLLAGRNWHPLPPALVVDFTLVNALPVPPGLVAWWPGGENATDASTNHNNGTLLGSTGFDSGEVGQAFSFSGDSDNVEIPNSTSLNPTNGITIDCWIWLAQETGDHRDVISKDGEYWDRQFLLTVADSGRARAHVGVSNVLYFIDATNTVPLSNWTHLAMTYDRTNLSLYVNGIKQTNGLVSGPIMTTTQPVRIGGGAPAGTPQFYFPGRIDEADIFNRALSSTEIKAIYDAGGAGKYNPNCVACTNANGWWPGDGHSLDIARTNNGTLLEGVGYASASVLQGFMFDGLSQNVDVPSAPQLHPTNAMTVEGWVFCTGNVGRHRDIFSVDGETYDRAFILSLSDSDVFRAHVSTGSGLYYVDGATTVELNGWYHVAMTYDGSKLALYVNGEPDASATLPGGGPLITRSQPFRIGGGAPPGELPYFFPGIIDEATLYDRALSSSEISAIYAAGSAGKCKLDADGDGLSSLQEAFLGTSDSNPDSDGDGVNDFISFWQGRHAATLVSDTNALINLKIYTPLK